MSTGISLTGTGGAGPAVGTNDSHPAPGRHGDRDLVAAVVAATRFEPATARRALTATLAALGGRLPRSTGRRLADRMPHDLARAVLAAAPTGARFGGFEAFVGEVAAMAGLDDAMTRVGVLAVGRTLQRWLPAAVLQQVCAEVPRVARLLLPDAWPGVSSDEQSILRTGRVGTLCTGPLPAEPTCKRRFHPLRAT